MTQQYFKIWFVWHFTLTLGALLCWKAAVDFCCTSLSPTSPTDACNAPYRSASWPRRHNQHGTTSWEPNSLVIGVADTKSSNTSQGKANGHPYLFHSDAGFVAAALSEAKVRGLCVGGGRSEANAQGRPRGQRLPAVFSSIKNPSRQPCSTGLEQLFSITSCHFSANLSNISIQWLNHLPVFPVFSWRISREGAPPSPVPVVGSSGELICRPWSKWVVSCLACIYKESFDVLVQ